MKITQGQIFQGWILRERKDGRKIFSLFYFQPYFPDMIYQHILHTNFDLASRVIVIFIITNFCVLFMLVGRYGRKKYGE